MSIKKTESSVVSSGSTLNETFFMPNEARDPQWHVINAEGEILGRLATKVANILRGKNKPHYTPHTDCGDYVVIINAAKVALSGKKWLMKEYITHSGWIGGKKVETAREKRDKNAAEIIDLAVKRMLPKNRLSRQVIKKLKVYNDAEHPHVAQIRS